MTNGNDPAFLDKPQTIYLHPTPPDCDVQFGLTKREYFAAMAMQATTKHFVEELDMPYMVKRCVAMADALIAELNKKGAE